VRMEGGFAVFSSYGEAMTSARSDLGRYLGAVDADDQHDDACPMCAAGTCRQRVELYEDLADPSGEPVSVVVHLGVQ